MLHNEIDYSAELASAFRNDLFKPHLLKWMKENDPREYMHTLPEDMQEIWIPCNTFVKEFGSQKNKRSKLMDMMEAIPPHVTKVNLDGIVDDAGRVWAFQMKRVLEALKPVAHVKEINLSSNKLFTLRSYRRKPKHVANNLFNMLMTGVSTSATSLDLSRNDPFPDFTSSWEIKPLLAKVEAKRISARRKNPLREETIQKYRAKIIADIKNKLSKIPEHIERLDLSYNYLHKFGVDGLLEILNVLFEKKNLNYIKLAGNLINERLGVEFLNKLCDRLDELELAGRSRPIISLMENSKAEKEFLENFDNDVESVSEFSDADELDFSDSEDTSFTQKLGLFDNDLDSLTDLILDRIEEKNKRISQLQTFGLFKAPKQAQPGTPIGLSPVRIDGDMKDIDVGRPKLA